MIQRAAWLIGTAVLITTATAAPAYAQQAPAEGANSQVGEIVVTAQRRSESIQRVPVSVTAVTADTLRSQQINDLSQVTRAAPSLQIGQDSTFAVRGVGTLAFASTIDSSVAVAVDEVNLGRPALNAPQFLDLERVEVLNGPQGLLFGKNASAGLINVVTTKPKLHNREMITDLEFDSRDTPGASRDAPGIIARQTVNLPLGSIAALRLNALYSYIEPPVTYVGTAPAGTRNDINRRSYQLKGKLLIAPSDDLSLYIIGDYNKLSGVGGIFTTTYLQAAPGSVNLPALALDKITPGPDNFLFGGEGGFWRDLKVGGAQANVSYKLSNGLEISNVAAWRFYDQNQQLDIDALSLNGASTNRTIADYNQYSNELRVALPASNRLSGQAGLYAFRSTLHQDSLIAGNSYTPSFLLPGFPFCVGAVAVPGAFPPTCSVRRDYYLGSDRVYTLNTTSLAAFGQLTYAITDALKLIAGGRLTHDKIDIDLLQGRYTYFVPLGGPSTTVKQNFKNDDFSWKLGAQYQATPTIMGYGFYGRGYKGPGFNDQAVTPGGSLVILPESSHTAEVGIKSSFLDRRVTLNVSAFVTNFSNLQVQSFDTNLQTFVVANAAKARSKGVEVAVAVRPIIGLTVNGAVSLLSSKFVKFPGVQCYPTQTTRGCSATNILFDASGDTLPVAPKFTSTLSATYDFPTGGEIVPFVQGNWYHRSTIHYGLSEAPLTFFGPVDIFGASVGAQLGRGVRVSLFCKNCTNEHVPTSISTDPGDASARDNRGRPTPRLTYNQSFNLDSVRTVGATLGFRF